MYVSIIANCTASPFSRLVFKTVLLLYVVKQLNMLFALITENSRGCIRPDGTSPFVTSPKTKGQL